MAECFLCALYDAISFGDYLPTESVFMIELGKKMSRTPMGKHIKYTYPIDILQEELGKL